MSITAILYFAAWLACLGLAITRAPIFGLYAYVVDFYFHPPSRWWGEDLPDLRWSLLAAVVTLVATMISPPKTDRPPVMSLAPFKLLLGFTLWVWVQSLWALDIDEHLRLAELLTKYLVMFFLIHRLIQDEKDVRAFLAVHVLGCSYVGWLILQAPGGEGRLDGLGGPGIGEANALGMQLATGLFPAAMLFATGKWWVRVLVAIGGVLILNGLVQTESRGAFLALLVGGLVFLWFGPAQWRWRWVGLGLLGLVIMLPRVPDVFWARMQTITAAVEAPDQVDQSASTRLALVTAQWQMFTRYPLGSGHRGTVALSAKYLSEEHLAKDRRSADPSVKTGRASHNTYLTVLAEHGAPGVLLFGGLLLWLARAGLSLGRSEVVRSDTGTGLAFASIVACVTTVLVAGMFRDYIKSEMFIWCVALLAVLQVSVSRSPSSAAAPVGGSIVLQPRSG
jgi:O-antigen ligase